MCEQTPTWYWLSKLVLILRLHTGHDIGTLSVRKNYLFTEKGKWGTEITSFTGCKIGISSLYHIKRKEIKTNGKVSEKLN